MNRIESAVAGQLAPAKPALSGSQVGAGLLTPAHGDLPCTVFAPLHYERNYAYPLLVWLHGAGGDEQHLKRIMPMISLRNYVAVAPRATSPGAGNHGYNWSQRCGDLTLAEQRVFASIELARERFHIATHRIFLAGFDTGGTMAFRLAMNHPRHFAGVLSLGGAFPTGQMPLARLGEARRVPIFLACGRDSEKLPVTRVCDDLKLFHAAGMHVALRQYPCGHQIDPLMLADMDRWIMEQITGE